MPKCLNFYSLALIYFAINLNHLESSSLPYDDAPTSSNANKVAETPIQGPGQIPNMRIPSADIDLSTLRKSEQGMLQWTEAWNGHNQVLYLVYWNTRDHVAIYFDYSVGSPYAWKTFDKPYQFKLYTGQGNAKWLFNFTSRVWDYMTRTYGQFGTDPNIYLVIHPENYNGAHRYFSLNPERNSVTRNRNILDLSSIRQKSDRKFGWYGASQPQKNMEMDFVVNQLSFFVEESSKDRLGSPSLNVWRNKSNEYTAWTDIFTYDVYIKLSMTDHAHSCRTSAIQKMETRGNIMWFKNWFLPIYEDHGGSRVLNSYFTLLRDNVPHVGVMYNYTLNMGEFIHFWSGAAETDLKLLATKAFGWNSTYQTQYLSARAAFTNVTALYNVSDTADIVTPAAGRKSSSMKTTKETGSSTKGDKITHVPTPWINSNTIETTEQVSANSTTAENTTPVPTTRSKSSTRKFTPDSLANTATGFLTKTAIVVIGGSVGAIIIITLILAFIAFCIFHKRKIQTLQTEIRALTNDEVKDFFDGDGQMKKDEAHALVFSSPFIKDFEISRDRMILDQNKVLGEGQFGTVVHGSIRQRESHQLVPAAVKTVKPNVDVICFKTFLSEVKIMAYLGIHENIVQLLGTCTSNIKNREIFIALEFCSLGNIEDFLKKNRHNFEAESESSIAGPLSVNGLSTESDSCATIKLSDLFKWSKEISNAMLYLTQKKVIHGDLAARNVLLTDNRVVKISDFGLSRQFLNYANYMKTSKIPVPWRWLSIEALNELKFSTASDVWAFGVTLWEIFSLAEIPYGAWTYDLFFVDRLLAGDRLLKPIRANQDLYKLMTECWMVDPAHRPTFQHIYNRLGEIITTFGASNGAATECDGRDEYL